MEYLRHAKKLDQEYNGTANNVQGPVETELNRLSPGGVVPLVIGCFGEVNSDLQNLIRQCCKDIAEKVWMKSGYLSPEVAAAQIYQSKMRKLGYMGIKSSSIIILQRMDMIGEGIYGNLQRNMKNRKRKFNEHCKRRNLEQTRLTSLKLGPRRYYSNFFKT